MQHLYIIDAHSDNQPVERIKLTWKDHVLFVLCACIAAWVVMSGLFAIIMMYGWLAAGVVAFAISFVILKIAGAI